MGLESIIKKVRLKGKSVSSVATDSDAQTDISTLDLSRAPSRDETADDRCSITAMRTKSPGSAWGASSVGERGRSPFSLQDVTNVIDPTENPFLSQSEVELTGITTFRQPEDALPPAADNSLKNGPPVAGNVTEAQQPGTDRGLTHARLDYRPTADNPLGLVVELVGPNGIMTLPVDLPHNMPRYHPARLLNSAQSPAAVRRPDIDPSPRTDLASVYTAISRLESNWVARYDRELPAGPLRILGIDPPRHPRPRRLGSRKYWNVTQLVPISTHVVNSIWVCGGLLCEGTFTNVYLVWHKPTTQELAMKVMYVKRPLGVHVCEGIINELKVLEILAALERPLPFVLGPSPVDRKWAWTSPAGFLHIISEFCRGGDLYYYKGQLSEDQLVVVLAEIALGIYSLHEIGIVHHDIKPENVLVTAQGHCAITDLGAAKFLDENGRIQRHPCGKAVSTIEYTAPEIFQDKRFPEYDGAVDWWSLGGTIITLATGKVYFEVDNKAELLTKCSRLLVELRSYLKKAGCFSALLIDLIVSLLHPEPQQRIRGKDVLFHPYFSRLLQVLPQDTITAEGAVERVEEVWEVIRQRKHRPALPVVYPVPVLRRAETATCKKWPANVDQDDPNQRYLITELSKEGLGLPEDSSCDVIALHHQALT